MRYKLIKNYPGCGLDIGNERSDFSLRDYYDIRNPEKWPEFFEPVKEHLFITKDGIPIYDKNYRLYSVDPDYYLWSNPALNVNWVLYNSNKEYSYFSTKESAEKWIDQNKPVFSKKVISDVIKDIHSEFDWKRKLIEKLGL
jgi:hypothetical protein